MKAAFRPDPPAAGFCPPVPAEVQEAIRRRAEEIYYRNGRIEGRDLENWAQAEREIFLEFAPQACRTAVAVIVNGIKYIGEYNSTSSGDYRPGEFGAGSNVEIRFKGEKMFVKRPNGKELETTIVCAVRD